MRSLRTILENIQEARLNLDNTQKAAVAYIGTAPTPQMAYSIVTGARNSVAARDSLDLAGYVTVDDENKTAALTPRGKEILTSENLVDDMGELTDRGKALLDKYMADREEWQKFESFKHLV